jgi:hypothetical protein
MNDQEEENGYRWAVSMMGLVWFAIGFIMVVSLAYSLNGGHFDDAVKDAVAIVGAVTSVVWYAVRKLGRKAGHER